MTRYHAALALVLACGAQTVHAQHAPARLMPQPMGSGTAAHMSMAPAPGGMPAPRVQPAAWPAGDGATPDRVGLMVVAGLGGAALGMLAGILIGADATNDFDGAAVGLAVGPMITVPIAVLMANRGRGSFGLMALGSIAVTAASLGVGYAADTAVPLLIGPAVNVGVSTGVARSTSRRSR